MHTIVHGIESWSGKTFQARKNYCCDNCGGLIAKNTTYLRNVVRLGAKKGHDPLVNRHLHLDCLAPWYHAESDNRAQSLGQLPRSVPPQKPGNQTNSPTLSVTIVTNELGTLVWALPKELSQKLFYTPHAVRREAARIELEQNLALALTALLSSVSNQRQAMKVSHAFHELQLSLPLDTPPQHNT